MSTSILVLTEDPVLPASLVTLATSLDASVDVRPSIAESDVDRAPTVVVVDLMLDGALDAPAVLRARWPAVLVAGSLAMPRRDVWDAAIAAGYDLVSNRGALAARLRVALSAWTGPARARRIRVLDAADIAGRLGVIARIDDTPVGPLAVYHVGGRVHAVADRCPHAGGQLSHGELDGPVVTCPLHGSQFDVTSGERLRGPSDDAIACYPVVLDGGVAYVELPPER